MNNNKIFFILFGRIPYSSGDQLCFYLSVILNKKVLMNKKRFQKKIIVATFGRILYSSGDSLLSFCDIK